jgi:primosomal protein N' (replication factor Y)
VNYADVAVDADRIPPGKTFSYRIPRHLAVEPGQLVWVQFGRRYVQGLVVSLSDASAVNEDETRDILHPVEPTPLVNGLGLELGQWMGRTYLCSPFEALLPFLPVGFHSQQRSRLTAIRSADDTADLASFRETTRDAWLQLVESGKTVEENDFLRQADPDRPHLARRELQRLVSRGMVRKEVTLPRPRTHRYRRFLVPGRNEPAEADGAPTHIRGKRQADLLAAVAESPAPYDATGVSTVADALLRRGIIAEEWQRVVPAIPAGTTPANLPPTMLTDAQHDATQRIMDTLDDPRASPRSFLLRGVTGSGKTEVYLRAIAHVLAQGRQAIYLVPEIALTPQTVGLMEERFPGRVAVLHHRLTDRQRFDQWWRIRDGAADLVVGPRSALFAPISDPGIIIVDEEHEPAYKQVEFPPYYHARDVALALARRCGAVVVMGSATPDIETYYQAQRGRHRLLLLPQRVPGTDGHPASLPVTEIVDMRAELREGNRSVFSRSLASALNDTIAGGHQAVLFLNRRGSAAFMQCRECGHVVTCSRCSVAYAFHADTGRLLCHYCNRNRRLPRACPQCRGPRIREMGAGTEAVVAELKRLHPGVSLDRWDSDALHDPAALEQAMTRLAEGKTQVLVGTQMVARGLDLPHVALSAALLADLGLNLPDFRGAERAFDLLCQVAGRAGRSGQPARSFIQTYQPDHYAVLAAASQNYDAFYETELASRRRQGNPPFNRLAQVVCADGSVRAVQETLGELSDRWRVRVQQLGDADVQIIGPTPCAPERVRGRYRWRLLLRGHRLWRFLEGESIPQNCRVEIDPVRLD